MVKDITLHIAAVQSAVPERAKSSGEAVLTAEREIYAKQVENKPANIVEKIVTGKLEKFYGQVCLVEQGFVKDPDKTITELLAETGKAAGDEFTVRRFVRWQLGA